MLIVSVVMILVAIYGFWGSRSPNPVHLSAFWGVLILCAVFLMIVGVLAISLPKRLAVAGCASTFYPQMAGINITATKAVK